MFIHHTKNYQSSLLMLHIRLICVFIIQRITRVATGNSLCDEELPVVTDTLYMAGMCVQNAKYFQTIDISNT